MKRCSFISTECTKYHFTVYSFQYNRRKYAIGAIKGIGSFSQSSSENRSRQNAMYNDLQLGTSKLIQNQCLVVPSIES